MCFWYSCFGVAACTIAMCCCLSSSFPNPMDYSLQSKDITYLTPQHSLGFNYHSWSSLSSMHTYKACLNAHVRVFSCYCMIGIIGHTKLLNLFRPRKLLDFRHYTAWLSPLYTFHVRGLNQFFFSMNYYL